MLKPGEKIIMQQVSLINDSQVKWPADTRLVLTASMTDLKITDVIHIGSVPVNAKVKISIKFDFKNSNQKRHLLQYQLCHSDSVANGRIG